MTYAQSFQLTGKTAAQTVQQGAVIVLEAAKVGLAFSRANAPKYATKATQIAYRVYLALDSREARQTYKMIWNLILIFATIVWAVGVTILKWADKEAAVMVNNVAAEAAAEAAVEVEAEQVEPEPEPEVLPFDPAVIEYPLPKTLAEIAVYLDEADRRELIRLAWGLVGTQYELVLPNKMKTDRLRRKLKEVLRIK